jgi:radical SAM superfamily enzyme YgiQ (UPF0313 family)
MKVLIANPPAFLKDPKRHFIQAGSRWSFSIFVDKGFNDHYLPYPFALGYASAVAKENTKAEIKGLDACALDLDAKEFAEEVRSYKPDLLLTDLPTISFPLMMDLLREVKSEVGFKLAIGGGHVTTLVQQVMENYKFVDYCLLGEYTLNFKELVNQLGNGGDLSKIRGIAYRRNGEVIVDNRELQKFNLDELPYPDREDFPVELYHDFEVAGKPCVQMLTSLGCPYKCSFCMPVRVMFGDSPFYRKRDPSKVVEEMRYAKEKHGAKQVYFDDDTFCVDRNRVQNMCAEIEKADTGLPWTAMGDITLDRTTLEKMAASGCAGVKFGVETASAATLQGIRKNFVNVEKVRQFVKWCRELDIWAHATYIIGLPGDRREDIEQTIEFSKKLGTDSVQFSIATPFPGTPFYEEAKTKGWLATDDWTRYDGANYSVLNYPWLSAGEIDELHRKALKDWYRNALMKELRNPRRAVKIIKAGSVHYAIRKTLSHLRGNL